MAPVRETFLEAAEFAARLVAEPAVAGRWGDPSALADMSVGALAGHLADGLPAVVAAEAVELLTRLAVRRHGAAALLRALSRAERAPGSIAAF